MADMTILDLLDPGNADLAAAAAAFTSGDKFYNQDRLTLLYVANGSGSTRTITIPVQQANTLASGFGKVTKGDIVRTIAAGKAALIGPFEKCYEDTNSKITVNADSVTTVTAVPIHINKTSA